MNVVIVHYHLNRGGVTQVIVNHLMALSATNGDRVPIRAAVFFGGRREAWPETTIAALPGLEVTIHEVPALEYDTGGPAEPDHLARALIAAFADAGLEPAETVVHIHNHALGKNSSLPGAIAILAREGFGLLLQVHDFAEDFRPSNYESLARALSPADPAELPKKLYWQASAIHYAVLNGRDRHILLTAGVPPERLHTLPNPVSESLQRPSRAIARQRLSETFGIGNDATYVLYPVRGIRRKNLGEILLWAAACGRPIHFGVTLAPLNPVERPAYTFWKQLVNQLRLPVQLETGASNGLTFPENLAAADRTISTSVAEGFGMVFLETWLANLSLTGRDLPEITADFVQAGVQLPSMVESLRIPIDWIGNQAFEGDLLDAYGRVLKSYRRPFPDDARFAREVSQICQDDLVDFARCSARLQADVVEQVATNAAHREQLIQLNPVVHDALTSRSTAFASVVRGNAAVVRREYSLSSAGQRLSGIYQSVLTSPRTEPRAIENGMSILDTFLRLSRLQPIRI